ncbi:uncharacterized protein B0I36DRAFT_347848 [Microdochium trichocladiopsis]|uniref:Uncharacterized protein n=1 Tax=Microdochium trichocladiopsis TaxID=1682393 RepID=A0A9P9BP17_9PEZI|nr:uncharacterized protein B0I36DRAFT_347848 [Microdochium trichocladiopsis]KAH7032664.1 hypothetical protein B0I36DRAFT_347848 [Microdochium trichocladiopsis]
MTQSTPQGHRQSHPVVPGQTAPALPASPPQVIFAGFSSLSTPPRVSPAPSPSNDRGAIVSSASPSTSLRDFSFFTPPSFYNPSANLRASPSSGPWTPSPPPAFTFSAGVSLTSRAGTPQSPSPASPPAFTFAAGSSRASRDGTPLTSSPSPTPRSLSIQSAVQSLEKLSLLSPRDVAPSSAAASNHAVRQLIPARTSLSVRQSLPAASPGIAPPSGSQACMTSGPGTQNQTAATREDTSSRRAATGLASMVASEPYNPCSEVDPQHEFFSPKLQKDYQAGIELAASIAACVAETVAQVPVVDAERLQHLLKDAQTLKDFRPSKTRTVAVSGTSGHGELHNPSQAGDLESDFLQAKAA